MSVDIPIPALSKRAYQERLIALRKEYNSDSAHAEHELAFLAAQWAGWWEARHALTSAMNDPTSTEQKVRILRRQTGMWARVYQLSFTRITSSLRRLNGESLPSTGAALIGNRNAGRKKAEAIRAS